jgi:hypothetical protein
VRMLAVASLKSISIYISTNTTGDIAFNLRSCLSRPVQSSMVPNLTVEVLLPRLVIPALSGEDGGCLDRFREVCNQLMFSLLCNVSSC